MIKESDDRKIMKKRTILFLFTMLLLITGCGKNKNKNTGVTNPDTKTGVQGEPFKLVEDDDDYTIQDIAELNGIDVEELNVLSGYNDGIVFLGNKYGDEIVTNEDEALASLRHIKTLANLKGVDLEYNRTDVSPVTGNVVYTFYQVAETELDGEIITAKFFNSLVKVITDKDGNLIAVSADVVPASDVEKIESDEVITKGEAIEYVKNLINDDKRRIYENVSEYAFWDDQGTVYAVNPDSKITPAWFIYTDADPKNSASKSYEVFVIALTPEYSLNEDDEEVLSPVSIASFYAETLDPDDKLDIYTSVFYFDGMENAGDYTYDIDLSWVKKYYPEYKGPRSASYTIPVMYSEKEDLYYLGDVEKKITLSNYYDFCMLDSTNAYVTSTPEDKNSWHFQLDKASDGSTGKYFDNPNYVLSSFSVMCDVWEDFYDRYGLDSVDGTGLPTMLTVYQIEEYDYPDKEENFVHNATNLGQNRDWQVMSTSIALPGCLEHEVMAHEYTHGINSQLTMSQYLNGPGAVMESYADIIGDQICMLDGYPECSNDNEWHMGGSYCECMRNMTNPKEYNMPQFLGGNYFLNPVDAVLRGEHDNGGVHTNSSILNYLAYCMVNGTGKTDETTLTMDECLDVWFDTLYYTNFQSDYYDVACYLQLSADSLGLDSTKREYIRTLLDDYGILVDFNGDTHPSFEEEYDTYHISVEYDDSTYNNLSEVFKLGFTYFDEDENYYDAGGAWEDGELYYGVDKGVTFDYLRYSIGNIQTGETYLYTMDELECLPHDMDVFFTVLQTTPGLTITPDPGYQILYATAYDDTEFDITENEDNIDVLTINNEGMVVVTLRNNDESTDDYGMYTILVVYTGTDY